MDVAGGTVGACLAAVFAERPRGRDYVLDDQGCLRRHVAVFVNGAHSRDLDLKVEPHDEIFVMQALSGG